MGNENKEKELRKAALSGDPKAMLRLGKCYYFGNGVTKNLAEVAKWYRKVADQGNATAMLVLGMCYEDGDGVTKDLSSLRSRQMVSQGR